MPHVRGTGTRVARALGTHPSAILLGAQLFAVLAYPFLDESTSGRVALGVLQPGIVLLAVYAVRRTLALTWVALLLGLPAVVFSVLEVIRPENDVVVVVSALVHAPFYFFVSYAMIRYLFHDDRVTRDELFATGAAFTVVAWGFAYLYAAVQVVWPGSFVGAGGPGDRSWFDLLFLSFTTLTSVGLSDVVPVLPNARSLVIVEQVAGVLYVALVVARLVGLTVVARAER
jgi:Ion channel